MVALKVTAFDGAKGVVLPEDVLARLNAREGDTLLLVETGEGYSLVARDSEIEAQMKVAKEGMRRYRSALRELAR